MSKNVINNQKAKEHIIESYRFKVLPTGDASKEDIIQEQIIEPKQEPEPNLAPPEPEPTMQSSFVEELLKKTDELSGNIIKLQMQIENQEAEFEKRLNEELNRTKELSKKEGFESAKVEYEQKIEEIKNKFSRSFSLLEQEVANFDTFLKSTESELSNAAIEVAKEVIKKEVSQNSSKVALALATELMKDLKDATKIEIKVSLQDYEYLKESFASLEHIKVTKDEAIALGGVIILSDVGNLDANLALRLEKLKHIVG